jgi:CheY-like chemotaxis protein
MSLDFKASDTAARAPRVLVVDDTVDLRALLERVLVRFGALAACACDGQEALDHIAAAEAAGRPFDAVLMDMQMPVLDGYHAARALRARGSTVLIVAMTADDGDEDIARCLGAGCDRHLAKPFNPTLLRTLVDELRVVGATTRA